MAGSQPASHTSLHAGKQKLKSPPGMVDGVPMSMFKIQHEDS